MLHSDIFSANAHEIITPWFLLPCSCIESTLMVNLKLRKTYCTIFLYSSFQRNLNLGVNTSNGWISFKMVCLHCTSNLFCFPCWCSTFWLFLCQSLDSVDKQPLNCPQQEIHWWFWRQTHTPQKQPWSSFCLWLLMQRGLRFPPLRHFHGRHEELLLHCQCSKRISASSLVGQPKQSSGTKCDSSSNPRRRSSPTQWGWFCGLVYKHIW